VLADLHLHFLGSVASRDLLDHLAVSKRIEWDLYDEAMRTAYGTIPPAREIVERYRRGDPDAPAAFDEIFVFGDADAGSFERFSAKYGLLSVGSVTAMARTFGSTAAEIAAEMSAFAAGIRAERTRQGLGYAEQRIMLGRDLDSVRDRTALDTLLTSYDQPDTGLTERLAVSLHRSDPWAGWERLQELALGPHGSKLVGVDFCSIEEDYPPKDQAAFFAAVQEFNAAHPERALAILYHVGESFADKSLESAVRWVQEAAELGAHRLGHAIALGIDPAVFGVHTRIESVAERRDQIAYDLGHRDGLRRVGVDINANALTDELTDLAARPDDEILAVEYDLARLENVRRRQEFAMNQVRSTGAVIEVCPTSNRRIGGITNPDHHPIHQFLKAELPVVIATDNPGIFGTTLDTELDWVCRQTGGGPELRRKLIATAYNSRSEILSGRSAKPETRATEKSR
jgi:adenosine deaminase